jgi:putative transposase
MEGSRNHRGKSNGRSYPFAGVNTAEDKRIEFHGIPKRGLNEATIAKYVREQEKHDQMMDRITTKEAEDAFRGS